MVDLRGELGERASCAPQSRADQAMISERFHHALCSRAAFAARADAVGQDCDERFAFFANDPRIIARLVGATRPRVAGGVNLHGAMGGHGWGKPTSTRSKRMEVNPLHVIVPLDPRGGNGTPRRAPTGFHELQSEQRDTAETGEKKNARDVAAGLLLRGAEEHAEKKTTDAAAAADESGHHADVLRETLRQQLE